MRRFEQTIVLIRRADQRGWLRSATDADSGLLATIGWALQGDASEALRYLDKYEGDYRVEAVRFMLAATTSLTPAVPPLGAGWDDVERLVSWGLLWQGRLDELIRMAPARDDSMVLNPNLILAYLWRGDVQAAKATWSRVPQEISQRAHSRFIQACILHAEGELRAALEETQAAIADSRRIRLPLDAVYEVFAAHLLVALGASHDAISVLESRLGGLAEAGDLAILEWAQCIFGRALLAEDRTREAQMVLQECVRSMMTAQRRVFLPAAAIYLSEAEARLGRMDEAHEMAEAGYHAASLIGSYFWLVDALNAVPAVLERQLKHDPNDSRWRRLLLSPSARLMSPATPRKATPSVLIDVQPFGPERDLFVNGERAFVGRLKVVELAACLALFPAGIDRFDLQLRLFPDSDQRRGGNHFRQISHKLREVTGVSLARTRQMLAWPLEAVVDSADIRFERLLNAAAAATGRDRMDRLKSALELMPGSYLESSDLAWVEERRYHLDVVREETLLELVELLYEFGDPAEVHGAAEQILKTNPYSEQAYRQLIRAERLIGTPSSVLSVYRRAVDALREIGLEPDHRTKELVRSLTAS
jgi:DNA-binding SARP family transcriptional activator